ncbi:MAG: hypothetical protein LC720_06320 [Actinobacteria bacterium]|nr:hypothetical protein [Actinomycetota bacterium]
MRSRVVANTGVQPAARTFTAVDRPRPAAKAIDSIVPKAASRPSVLA